MSQVCAHPFRLKTVILSSNRDLSLSTGFVACSNKPSWLEYRAADDENSQKNG
jgi:hypothetical protein